MERCINDITYARAREEELKEGLEKAIKAFIHAARNFEVPEDKILWHLQNGFQLKPEQDKKYLSENISTINE